MIFKDLNCRDKVKQFSITSGLTEVDLDGYLVARQEDITQEYGTQFDGTFFIAALTGHGVEMMFNHAAEVEHRFTRQANDVAARPIVLDGSGAVKKSGCC
jgi:hypothetical protein